MLAEERQAAIQDRLSRDGKVLAGALAQEFGVSEDTIRRDLRELAGKGVCRKVYGGALTPAPPSGPIGERLRLGAAAKARLAAEAVRLVRPGQTLLIDAGTTNLAIAAALPRDLPLTVVTNAPGVAAALAEHELARILVLGGVYDRLRGACLGAATLRDLERINADLVFLGACAVHPAAGVTAFDPAEAEVKRAMAARGAALAAAAASDKLCAVAPFQAAPAEALSHLIVEAEADPQALDRFRELGVCVRVAL